MVQKLPINTNMKTMNGLSLIELMAALALVAILIAIGLPQLQGMSGSNRMASTINLLAHDLNQARSEANNRNRRIDVTAVAGNWANGWVISAPVSGALPAIAQLKTASNIPTGMTLTELNNTTVMSYGSDGLNAAGTNLVFTLCNPNKKSRVIDVSTAGRLNTHIKSGAVPTSCP